MSIWWMSFRDEVKNINLGVCVVEARNEINASQIAHAKGINPGGEVLLCLMTEKDFRSEDLELNRLYSREEMMVLGYEFD